MKHIFKFSLVTAVMVGLVFIACNRKKQDVIGPAYIDAPAGIAITNFKTAAIIPAAGVNFLTTKVTFLATFNATATWVLTVKGEQSGAEYRVSGTGSSFSEIWGGSYTNLKFFRSGEMVTATVSFYGSSVSQSLSFKIQTKANLNSCGVYPRNADFENPNLVYPSSGNWANFNQPAGTIVNVEQGITGEDSVNFSGDRFGNKVPALQGKNFYYIRGLGDAPSFVSGLLYSTMNVTPLTSSDPNNIWFNVYIYGTGDANAGLDMEFQEDDDLSGAYDATSDDAWVYHMDLTHTGWKLVSFKYSDLTINTNPILGGSGNKKMEPTKLKQFDFVLLKRIDRNSPVEVFIDYPIFSYGGPFKPCK